MGANKSISCSASNKFCQYCKISYKQPVSLCCDNCYSFTHVNSRLITNNCYLKKEEKFPLYLCCKCVNLDIDYDFIINKKCVKCGKNCCFFHMAFAGSHGKEKCSPCANHIEKKEECNRYNIFMANPYKK